MTAPFQSLTSLNQVHHALHKNTHVTRENAKPIIIMFFLLSFHHIKSPDFLAKFMTGKGKFLFKMKPLRCWSANSKISYRSIQEF
jgi:hypothetical protein